MLIFGGALEHARVPFPPHPASNCTQHPAPSSRGGGGGVGLCRPFPCVHRVMTGGARACRVWEARPSLHTHMLQGWGGLHSPPPLKACTRWGGGGVRVCPVRCYGSNPSTYMPRGRLPRFPPVAHVFTCVFMVKSMMGRQGGGGQLRTKAAQPSLNHLT